MKTDFTVAEDLHRRTNNSSIDDDDRERMGSAVSNCQITTFIGNST